jgi:hypothetical protein
LISQVSYAAMSDQELKQYFLRHREDRNALRIYLDRFSDRPRDVITNVDDPNFGGKIQAAIAKQIKSL